MLVVGSNFGGGPLREQAATALLAKDIALVVTGIFGNIFARNSINNALMGLELPCLVERLRERFPSAGGERRLMRRTGWTLTWDVKWSVVEVEGGQGGREVGEEDGRAAGGGAGYHRDGRTGGVDQGGDNEAEGVRRAAEDTHTEYGVWVDS